MRRNTTSYFVTLIAAVLSMVTQGLAAAEQVGAVRLSAGQVLPLQVVGSDLLAPDGASLTVPVTATAAALNVTAVTPAAPGFITVWPCGVTRPLASNLNFVAGDIVPNGVIAPIGSDGTVCLYAFAATDVVVDVAGWFEGDAFVGATPKRLVDTRDGTGGQASKLVPQSPLTVQVGGIEIMTSTGVSTLTPQSVPAVALNVTVVNPDSSGFITVYPCDVERPLASNVNYQAGQVVANGVIAPVSASGQICVYSLVPADVIVDLAGWFPGAAFTGSTPTRLVDTRDGTGGFQGKIDASTSLDVAIRGQSLLVNGVAEQVPTGATAAALNVTVVSPAAPGFATVWPCSAERPLASNLNFTAGQVVANNVIAPIGEQGRVCFFSNVPTDIVIDIAGFFSGSTGNEFVSSTPKRFVDTRSGLGPVPVIEQSVLSLVSGSLSALVPDEVNPESPTRSRALHEVATDIEDWSGANITVTNASGEEVANGTANVDGNFEVLLPANEHFYFRVRIGNLLLMYYFPPASGSQIIDVNPRTTAEMMVLVSATGLALGVPGVVAPQTPEELAEALNAADPGALDVIANNVEQQIQIGFDDAATEQNQGGADTVIQGQANVIATAGQTGVPLFIVEINIPGGGSLSADGSVPLTYPVMQGDNLILQLFPDRCFEFVKVSNGAYLYDIETGSLEIVNIQDHRSIQVLLSRLKVRFDAMSTAGGTISNEGITIIDCGTTFVYDITPDDGFVIADVTVNGESRGPVTSLTFDENTQALPPEASSNSDYSVVASFNSVLTEGHGTPEIQEIPTGLISDGHSSDPTTNSDGSTSCFTTAIPFDDVGDINGDPDLYCTDEFTATPILTSLGDGSGTGTSGFTGSGFGEISIDGRFVVYLSTEAVAGSTPDTNRVPDIYLVDRETSELSRASVPNLPDQAILGTESDRDSQDPAISDGRFITYWSNASNLVLGDSNSYADIFVYDQETRTTTRVSVPNIADQDTLGTEAAGLGFNGGNSFNPDISGDGNIVVFHSAAINLVLNDASGNSSADFAKGTDVFSHNRSTGETRRISVPAIANQGTLGTDANNNSRAAKVSRDGKFVAFQSDASNLVPGDTNDFCDLLSNGQLVNCTDIFLYEFATDALKIISLDSSGSQSDGVCRDPSISDDGLFVTFVCNASNLVENDTNNFCDNNFDQVLTDNCSDIFVHNTVTGETALVSRATDGTQGDGPSDKPAISGSGEFIVFESLSTTLVEGGSDSFSDIFRAPNPLYVVPTP